MNHPHGSEVAMRLRETALARTGRMSASRRTRFCGAVSECGAVSDADKPARCILLAENGEHRKVNDWLYEHVAALYPAMDDPASPTMHLGVESWYPGPGGKQWPRWQLFIVDETPPVPFGGVNGAMRAPGRPKEITA